MEYYAAMKQSHLKNNGLGNCLHYYYYMKTEDTNCDSIKLILKG